MKFLGIDLGWTSGASGLCCLGWQSGRLVVLDLQCQGAIASVLAWVDQWLPAGELGGIAVDAPTLIPNRTGMRLPDRLAHQYFGRYHAGCYPANLGRPFAERLVCFGLSLEARGFHHAPTMIAQTAQRYQIEVFPHPTTIHLFGLDRILKYKKGKLADRRAELSKLRQYIQTVLPTLEPGIDWANSAIALPEIPQRGVDLKHVEDQLDSLLCAYVAAHWWYWGSERNWVLGDRSAGYIIVPAPVAT
jgi:predicted RNase H-like nuclease